MEIKRKNKVFESKIEEKDQRWHTRNRITLVFGSNETEKLNTYLYDENKKIHFQELDFHQAKSKAIEELIDNCIDEFYRGNVTQINIELLNDGTKIIVEDNGIGFDVNKIVDVYTKYRTGSKFKDEDTDEKGFLNRTLGQNGMGAAATCLTADEFKVRVRQYNTKKEKTVLFIDGALKIKEEKPKPFKGHSGVRIEAILSKEVYKNNVIDKDLLRKRVIDLAYNNPGLIFLFNGEKIVSKRGIQELAALIEENNNYSFQPEYYIYNLEVTNQKIVKGRYDISFALTYNKEKYENEKYISFINSTPTYDGGFHHDKIKKIFTSIVKTKLEKIAKKEKIEIIDKDILMGMSFVVSIVMPNPRFESQTKRKLVKDLFLDKAIEELFENNVEKFLRRKPEFLEICLERASERNNSEILKEANKLNKKTNRIKVDKLLDANEKNNRRNCTIFICEGDSAIGGLRNSRDKLTQGGIALKGKPMNVLQSSTKDVIANKEFSDIMMAIGLNIADKNIDLDSLRFTNIVLLADSDVDGGHINTLLINFFYKYWKDLFKLGCIQVAKAPLFEVITKNDKRLFIESEEELLALQKDGKIQIKEIQRNKGLGEMSEDAWKFLLAKKEYTKIKINDAEDAANMINVCFGKDTQLRKNLLLAKPKKE